MTSLNILVITHLSNGLLMIAMPFGLALLLAKHWKLGWRIWWIGFATFIISQAGHITFNWGMGLLLNQTGITTWSTIAQKVFNSAFLGLSAGLFEEGTRYLVLRFWIKNGYSWRNGVLFGAGHGGSEAIILGILALVSSISMLVVRGQDLNLLLSPSQIDIAQQQITSYWSAPWYESMLGALERLFTIPVQIALAVMVMQAFTRKKIGWLFVAILYHAIIDGIVVFLYPTLGVYWTEGLVGGFSVMSVIIIILLLQPEPIKELVHDAVPGATPTIKPVDETSENLDSTRYLN